jgi:hypothetical protein
MLLLAIHPQEGLMWTTAAVSRAAIDGHTGLSPLW